MPQNTSSVLSIYFYISIFPINQLHILKPGTKNFIVKTQWLRILLKICRIKGIWVFSNLTYFLVEYSSSCCYWTLLIINLYLEVCALGPYSE